MELPELKSFSHDLHTIFSELISNAIDHGLLGLDSALKQTADGFQKYYEYRIDRLNQLSDQSILIMLRHEPDGDGGLLTIEVKDSGPGFNKDKVSDRLPSSDQFSGRGIPMLKKLCESVDYIGNGNTARVCYRWHSSALEQNSR